MEAATANVKLSKVSYVILFVRDVHKALEFYRDKLGMQVKSTSTGWAELDGGGVTIALHHHENGPTKRAEGMPQIVFEVDDITETYETLKSRGVSFLETPRLVHKSAGVMGLAAEFRDRDGNHLSVYGIIKSSDRPM